MQESISQSKFTYNAQRRALSKRQPVK